MYIDEIDILYVQAKRAVVVTARVHPGETNSSWMMKGLIDVLTSDSSDAEVSHLRACLQPHPLLSRFYEMCLSLKLSQC